MTKIIEFVKTLEDFTEKNKPAVLAGAAVCGVVVTGVSAYKAGVKAKDILRKYKEDIAIVKDGDKESEHEVKKEYVVSMAKTVAPPLIFGGATIASIIGSTVESSRRIAVLSAAYALSENKSATLVKKMDDILGKEKSNEIRKEAAKETADKNKTEKIEDKSKEVVKGGGCKCFDAAIGRSFEVPNANYLERKILDASRECMGDMFLSLNELYDRIGLPGVGIGYDFGWNVDDLDGGRLPIRIDSILDADTGEPQLLMDYNLSQRF